MIYVRVRVSVRVRVRYLSFAVFLGLGYRI